MVSIIIPAYNVEKYIYRAIESCIKQTFQDIEIIIVDDGSTDNTYRVISEYAVLDERIHVFKQENKGVSSARNKGLKESKGEFVVFLDSDDWVETIAVSELLKEYKRGFLACFNYNLMCIQSGKVTKVMAIQDRIEDAVIYKDKLIECFSQFKYGLENVGYKLFERQILLDNHIMFNPDIHDGEDGLFVFQYLLCVDGIVYRNRRIWNHLIRPGSATLIGYNKKVATALDAAEIILSYDKYNSNELSYLRLYYTERAIGVKYSAIRSNASLSLEEKSRIDTAVRIYIWEYIKCNHKLVKKMNALLIAWLPYTLLKPILYIKGILRKRFRFNRK